VRDQPGPPASSWQCLYLRPEPQRAFFGMGQTARALSAVQSACHRSICASLRVPDHVIGLNQICLIWITPTPRLPGFDGPDQRVSRFLMMLASMLQLRTVTTPSKATGHAFSNVNPFCSYVNTCGALRCGWFGDLHSIQVSTIAFLQRSLENEPTNPVHGRSLRSADRASVWLSARTSRAVVA
jgi:hypothetical protein